MFWKFLYSAKSPSEHGTLYQLRNVMNRRNVVKKPIDNFNACDDFFCDGRDNSHSCGCHQISKDEIIIRDLLQMILSQMQKIYGCSQKK